MKSLSEITSRLGERSSHTGLKQLKNGLFFPVPVGSCKDHVLLRLEVVSLGQFQDGLLVEGGDAREAEAVRFGPGRHHEYEWLAASPKTPTERFCRRTALLPTRRGSRTRLYHPSGGICTTRPAAEDSRTASRTCWHR